MDPTPLNQLAYIMCPKGAKLFYNSKLQNVPKWPEMRKCCEALMMPSLHPSLQHGDAISVIAAKNGHMFCLTRAHEKGLAWSRKTSSEAAAAGNFDMLMVLLENRCPYDYEIMERAAANDHRDILCVMQMLGMLIDDETMEAAARNGQVKCMKYLMREHGVELSADVLIEAGAGGSIEAVRFVCQKGFVGDHSIGPLIEACTRAAANGFTDCVKYIHQNMLGGILPDSLSVIAARTGNLDCLRYCAESGDRRTIDVINAATQHGRIRCLEYAHRRGYPWDESTWQAAALCDDEEMRHRCLTYLRRHRCPSNYD